MRLGRGSTTRAGFTHVAVETHADMASGSIGRKVDDTTRDGRAVHADLDDAGSDAVGILDADREASRRTCALGFEAAQWRGMRRVAFGTSGGRGRRADGRLPDGSFNAAIEATFGANVELRRLRQTTDGH